MRRPLRWAPVDRIRRSGSERELLRLHGRLVGVQVGHHMYVVKVLHARAERGCGQHQTYHAPWD